MLVDAYLGCKQHGWDVANHGSTRHTESTKETANEGNDGKDERGVTFSAHGPLQNGRLIIDQTVVLHNQVGNSTVGIHRMLHINSLFLHAVKRTGKSICSTLR